MRHPEGWEESQGRGARGDRCPEGAEQARGEGEGWPQGQLAPCQPRQGQGDGPPLSHRVTVAGGHRGWLRVKPGARRGRQEPRWGQAPAACASPRWKGQPRGPIASPPQAGGDRSGDPTLPWVAEPPLHCVWGLSRPGPLPTGHPQPRTGVPAPAAPSLRGDTGPGARKGRREL